MYACLLIGSPPLVSSLLLIWSTFLLPPHPALPSILFCSLPSVFFPLLCLIPFSSCLVSSRPIAGSLIVSPLLMSSFLVYILSSRSSLLFSQLNLYALSLILISLPPCLFSLGRSRGGTLLAWMRWSLSWRTQSYCPFRRDTSLKGPNSSNRPRVRRRSGTFDLIAIVT